MLLPKLTNIAVKTFAAGFAVMGLLLLGCVSCDAQAETPDQLAGHVVQMTLTADVAAEKATAATDTWYILDDNDVPYTVACAACPGGTRQGTWAEAKQGHEPGFWLQAKPSGNWAYAVTEPDGQIARWYVWERGVRRLIPNPRLRRAVNEHDATVPASAAPTYSVPMYSVPAWSSGYGGYRGYSGGCASGRCGGGG